MIWFGKQKPAKVARVAPERLNQIKLERGSVFKALTEYYGLDRARKLPDCAPGDWVHVEYIRGWCNSDMCKAAWRNGITKLDHGDFHLRLFSFVKMRGGKFYRYNQGIFVSARLPHTDEHRGMRYPGGMHSTHDFSYLPDDPRLIPALKKYGVDVRGLKLGGGRS